MIYCFDIDGTICSFTDGDYESAVPFSARIEQLNKLFIDGHNINNVCKDDIVYISHKSTRASEATCML